MNTGALCNSRIVRFNQVLIIVRLMPNSPIFHTIRAMFLRDKYRYSLARFREWVHDAIPVKRG
jgi:hypothetical protein